MARRTTARRIRRFFGFAFLLVLLALPLVAAVVFLGVPSPLLRLGLRHFSPEQIALEADQLYFRPGEGVVMENLEVYSRRDRVTPLLTLDRIQFSTPLLRSLRRGSPRGGIEFHGGVIDTNLGLWADDLVTDQPVKMTAVHGKVGFNGDAVDLEGLTGKINGIVVQLDGEVPFALFRKKPRAEPPFSAEEALRRLSRNAAPALAFLDQFEFRGRPELRIESHSRPELDIPLEVRFESVYGGGGTHRGYAFDALRIRAGYLNGVLTIDEATVMESEARKIALNGEVDFNNRLLSLHIENSLQRYGLEALSPFPLGALLSRLQIRVQDRCDFTLDVGPSSFERIGHTLKGRFHVRDAFFKDAFFPDLQMELTYGEDVLELDEIEGTIGQGTKRGPLSGSLLFDRRRGRFDLDLEGAFKPAAAASLVTGTGEKYIRDLEFRGKPPGFSLHVHRKERADPVDMALEFTASEVLFRGTLFEFFGGKVLMDKETFALTDIHAFRGEETLKGGVYAPRDLESCEIHLVSSFHLPDLAPLLGGRAVEALRPFRFQGASWFQVNGHLDFSGRSLHALSGKLNFTQLVYRWMKFDRLSASFELDNGTLRIPDLKGDLVEGSMRADFVSRRTFSPDARFQIALDLKEVDLFKVITAATDTESTPYTGNLFLDLDLTGRLLDTPERTRSASFDGKGYVEIRDGELFRIPLLLGLSRILSKVVKGFGYAAQSDFTADFRIEDGVIRSDNLFLKGRLLSIAGDGSYRFDGKIGANLKVQLLSDGIISDALKVLLWPIRKLIEVQLGGTLENPDWQPRNLPRELFGK